MQLDTVRVRPSGYAAALGLAGIGAVHAAWGRGSSFPFGSRDELADAAIGGSEVPPPMACNAVAGLLVVASGLAVDVAVGPPGFRRLGRMVVAGILAIRGAFGLAGRTDLLSPGSDSPRFVRLDRKIYSPLCLTLSLATATAVRRTPEAGC